MCGQSTTPIWIYRDLFFFFKKAKKSGNVKIDNERYGRFKVFNSRTAAEKKMHRVFPNVNIKRGKSTNTMDIFSPIFDFKGLLN